MKIRMKIQVLGTFHGLIDGVRIGDVVEVDDGNGERYCKLGYAEAVKEQPVKHEPEPEDESADAVASAPKPRPPRASGRPRRTV